MGGSRNGRFRTEGTGELEAFSKKARRRDDAAEVRAEQEEKGEADAEGGAGGTTRL
ncbi:hypothetical protein [Rubrobacter marinus]|uniref:hypothetical protein n=1 Tax=Rubrobacter marinus TaxID=2653852 RepID=UPI00140E4240|nr:hypothetical protein [Rubrobacter marinus]